MRFLKRIFKKPSPVVETCETDGHWYVFAPGVGMHHTWCHRCGKYFGYHNPDKIVILL